MSLDTDIRIGDRAAQLLQDEVLTLAFANIERDCLAKWRTSPVRDTEARESIWFMLRQLDAVKAELERLASESTMAHSKVDEENKRREAVARQKQAIADQLGIDPKYIR